MRRIIVGWTVFFITLFLTGAPGAARADTDIALSVNLDFFHDRLATYGDWVQLSSYGWAWRPWDTAYGWRPYMDGRWVLTDWGWTWDSDDPWGWATDHYGRWLYDASYGWVWVPGNVWGPAWVVWQWGDGYVGWAPMPPGIDVLTGDFGFDLDPFSYCFVEEQFFLEPSLVTYVQPVARNVTCLGLTRNVTRYTVSGGRYVDRGVDVREIERASGRIVTRLRLRDVNAPTNLGRSVSVQSNELRVYRPAVRPLGSRRQPAAVHTEYRPSPPVARETQAEMAQRQAEERRQLQAMQIQERQRLRSMHGRERTSPPPQITRDELRERQRREDQAQAQHEQAQQRELEARHERERQTFGPPRGAGHVGGGRQR